MARNRNDSASSADAVISIIAAGKAIVIGKDGVVDGHVITQDAIIAGVVTGTVRADSRLEVQATARIEGEVSAKRMQLEEGAILNGQLTMGEVKRSVQPQAGFQQPAETAVDF